MAPITLRFLRKEATLFFTCESSASFGATAAALWPVIAGCTPSLPLPAACTSADKLHFWLPGKRVCEDGSIVPGLVRCEVEAVIADAGLKEFDAIVWTAGDESPPVAPPAASL